MEEREVVKEPEENYVEGCHEANYMEPHVCPMATGGWCRDFVKCRNLEVESDG